MACMSLLQSVYPNTPSFISLHILLIGVGVGGGGKQGP